MQNVTLYPNQHWAQLSTQCEIIMPKHPVYEVLVACRTEVAWIICVLLACITAAIVASRVMREQEHSKWTAVEADIASLRLAVEDLADDEA